MDFDFRRSPPASSMSGLVTTFLGRARSVLPGPRRDDPVWTLSRTHRSLHPGSDVKLIRHAYEVAERMHRGQMRKSGDPYITHPLEVAEVLAELGMDTTTLVAALLHDTVEDTRYTMPELRDDFGTEVALLVDGVTKFDKHHYGKNAEVETIRKMLVAADQDVRVLIIKLADRLHNMRTLDARSPASRARIARATQEVLIPLCDRLGIQALKREIEDSVLAALEPEAFKRLQDWVGNRPEWNRYLHQFINLASSVLRAEKIRATVQARPRHLYTVWKDNRADGHVMEHELPRIVVIVNGPETECYTALGAVHQSWRPVPGRFKDFIASPKNNLYRSLHTTVIGPDRQQVEVLIRTETMHRNAEFGVVASFRFRRGQGAHTGRRRARGAPDGGEHLDWLRRVVQWQREAADPVRFFESLRCDLAEKQILVFSHGERLLLPDGSTPVDIAYALGNEIGERCIAATVNGQLAFLSSPLADGDVVEIHTVPEEETASDGGPVGPSAEWLGFVRTPHAQLQITRWLARQEEMPDPDAAPPVPIATKVRIGRSAVSLELLRRQRGLAVELPLLALTEQLGYPDVETLFVAVAEHKITADEVVEQLIAFVDSEGMRAATTQTGPGPRSRGR